MLVQDLLTHKLQMVNADVSLSKAAEMMRNLDTGVMPVMENGEIIGMITDRDITIRGVAFGKGSEATQISDVMTRKLVSCTEDMYVTEAAGIMENIQIRRLLVQNEQGGFVGILGMADLARVGKVRGLAGEVMSQVTRPTDSDTTATPNATAH